MSGRHYITSEQRILLKERADAYASVTGAMRAMQDPHKPHSKAWLVLEAGILWLQREQTREKP